MPEGTVLFDSAILKTNRGKLDSAIQAALASVHWDIGNALPTREPVGVAVYKMVGGVPAQRVGYDCIGSPMAQVIASACGVARERKTNEPYAIGIFGIVSEEKSSRAENLIRRAIAKHTGCAMAV